MLDLDRVLEAVRDTLTRLYTGGEIPVPADAVEVWEAGHLVHLRIHTAAWSDVLLIKPKLAAQYLRALEDPESHTPRFVSATRTRWEAVIREFVLGDHKGELDFLSEREGRYCMSLLDRLQAEAWIRPLTDRLRREGVCKATKTLLFELRFAAELSRLGLRARYEHDAGAGGTVDFLVEDQVQWLVELVRVEPSDAVKGATRKRGPFLQASLCSHGKDKKQSEEAELIRIQTKIAEKVSKEGKPTKFPTPKEGVFHMILADVRNCGLIEADHLDCREIAYGACGFQPNERILIHRWPDEDGNLVPIRGLFDEANPLCATRLIRERIHVIGFAREKEYGDGWLLKQTYYLPNPLLLETLEAQRSLCDKIPFRPELAGK